MMLMWMVAMNGGEDGAEGLRGDDEEVRGQARDGLQDDRGEGEPEGGGRGAPREGEEGAQGQVRGADGAPGVRDEPPRGLRLPGEELRHAQGGARERGGRDQEGEGRPQRCGLLLHADWGGDP